MTPELIAAAVRLADALAHENRALAALDLPRAAGMLEDKTRALEAFAAAQILAERGVAGALEFGPAEGSRVARGTTARPRAREPPAARARDRRAGAGDRSGRARRPGQGSGAERRAIRRRRRLGRSEAGSGRALGQGLIAGAPPGRRIGMILPSDVCAGTGALATPARPPTGGRRPVRAVWAGHRRARRARRLLRVGPDRPIAGWPDRHCVGRIAMDQRA